MRRPFVLDPAPFVTRWRRRTVANGDSITFEVLRCFQCAAGKSKKVSRTSASCSKVVTAFGYLAPYSPANRVIASRAFSRVSAYITSWRAAFTRGWSRLGSLSTTLPSLWTQSRCSREGMPLVVTFLSVYLEVRSDLGFQSRHEHTVRTLAGNLVEQGSPVHPFHHRLVAGDPQHRWRLFPLVRRTEAVRQPRR